MARVQTAARHEQCRRWAWDRCRKRYLRAVLFLILVAPLTAIHALPLHGAPLAQPTTPQTILNEPDIIQQWRIGGGFVYWYENCRIFLDQTEAFLNRRAVNGSTVQNLVDIDDENACETLRGAAADDSGFYYYNHSAGTIEAIYTNTPTEPPAVLVPVGDFVEIGFGDAISAMFLDKDHVYWIEVEPRGEFIEDVNTIRRTAKHPDVTPAAVETILTYEGYFAGHSMVFTDDFIFWTDSEGLNRIPKSCANTCTKAKVHETLLRRGHIAINDGDEMFWWDANPTADRDPEIFYTRCPPAAACQTQSRYTAPDLTSIRELVANQAHVYWIEQTTLVGNRLLRLAIVGGSPQPIREDDVQTTGLALDDQGVYFQPTDRRRIVRLALDAQAIQREISFGGWEVTQAIQNIENGVPLVAGKQTFVRVYPALDSGANSAGVEARLYGERAGVPLEGSPLRPLNGTIVVEAGNALANRADVDSGWLFQLPMSWTKQSSAAIPLEDAELTLRVELDPKGLTGDTTPGNNSAEDTFTFTAKAPTCINLRSVWTDARYQSPWDISVAATVELGESIHPTPRFLVFPEYNPLSRIEWCWKGIFYGPFCSGPYTDLDSDDSGLLTKMGILDFFHDNPSICFATSARTLYGGIVSSEKNWQWAGLARRGKDQFLSKVPRYGTWSWPLTRASGLGMTFVHEIGHNYSRRHIDCGGPKNPDSNYPYATDTLDNRPLDAASTHFGFDTRLLHPIAPDTNRDYMSYCAPRWISDYTWRALFNNTRPPVPLLPFGAASSAAATPDQATPDAYVQVSGMITPTLATGELSPAWNYPTAAASTTLIQKWEAAVAEDWTVEPYHIRVVDSDGAILIDKAVELAEIDESQEPEVNPFHVVFPAPQATVAGIHLMNGETVLDSISPGAAAPQVTILTPQGGETVEDTFTLQWSATDPDGAPALVYTVQYSPNGGESWYSLLAEYPGPGKGIIESLSVDLRGQPGSEGATALLRVLAGDGYNTGLATSAPFTVVPRAPDVIITAPEEGQQFSAGAPVSLRGSAYDPEDGALDDDAYLWNISDSTNGNGTSYEAINDRVGVLLGLAPGVYTATLQATDSDEQQGEAQVSFRVTALNIPFAADLSLDGYCDDTAYGALSLPLAPYASGEAAQVALARTADHLWVCLQGLEESDTYAGIQIDVDNSQDTTVQSGDLGFFVKMDGTPVTLAGNAGAFEPVAPTDMAAHISENGSTWNAELRIHVDALGGWNRRVALGIGQYPELETGESGESRPVWPHTATFENPQSWAQTNLGMHETLSLSALSPVSAVIHSSIALTLTGAGFQANTIALWNGEVLSTTTIDDGTLLATVGAPQNNMAGLHYVQVAPEQNPQVTSAPLPLLVFNTATAAAILTPDAVQMGSPGFTLGVEGAGFVEGATVLWDGDARPTSFISSTRLEAQISAQDLTVARAVSVTVANPDPNLGISAAANFNIVQIEFELFLPRLQSE